MLMARRLGLRSTTVRMIVDRLPAQTLKAIIIEAYIKEYGGYESDHDLKPCPFCGGSPSHAEECDSVMCDECHAIGGEHANRAIAAALWNRRVEVAR